MDAHSLINYNNRENHDDEEDIGESGTRLCDLPDAILQEIISNLPTNYAVQTSVLSKRWIDTWKGITKIDLEELGAPEKRQLFIDFMEKLLVVCKSSLIKNFSLIFKVGEEASRVSEWLRVFANPNNIEELKLELENVQQPITFPDHFFSSQTLTKLQLSMKQVINLPSYINFTNLVSLTIKHVTFPAGESTDELFSGCQFLKELALIDCKWTNVSIVCIRCPLLEKLSITEWKGNDEDGLNEHAVEGIIPAVPNFLARCQVMIFGNNLKTFSIDGNLRNDYFLSCTHSIINASIEVKNLNDLRFVFNFIRTASNVIKLTLSDYAVEVLSKISNLIEYLPLFHQLGELCVGSTSLINLSSPAFQNVLRAILHRSPLLNEVKFAMQFRRSL